MQYRVAAENTLIVQGDCYCKFLQDSITGKAEKEKAEGEAEFNLKVNGNDLQVMIRTVSGEVTWDWDVDKEKLRERIREYFENEGICTSYEVMTYEVDFDDGSAEGEATVRISALGLSQELEIEDIRIYGEIEALVQQAEEQEDEFTETDVNADQIEWDEERMCSEALRVFREKIEECNIETFEKDTAEGEVRVNRCTGKVTGDVNITPWDVEIRYDNIPLTGTVKWNWKEVCGTEFSQYAICKE